MILAMHQPYFLPWGGWFAKFRAADVFVVMDSAQVPTSRKCYSRQVKIAGRWLKIDLDQKGLPHNRTSVLGSSKVAAAALLGDVYRHSPGGLVWFLQNLLQVGYQNLCAYNMHLTKVLCREHSLDWSKVVYLSQVGIDASRQELPVLLCSEFDCSVYLSGVGAASYNVPDRFREAGVELRYCKHNCGPFSAAHNILQGDGLGMGESDFLPWRRLHEDCSH